ncbi:MAG: AmmeMemoRadiSam system radical SAM enzyme, partial [Endomicrobiia bacterium]
PTPIEKLEKAYKIARESGINYVSLGNVPGHNLNSTFCPKCNQRIIHRVHFQVIEKNVVEGKCKFCKNNIPGVWN